MRCAGWPLASVWLSLCGSMPALETEPRMARPADPATPVLCPTPEPSALPASLDRPAATLAPDRPADEPLRLLEAPRLLTEGEPAVLAWSAGPRVYSVAVTAGYHRTPLGGRSRGDQTLVLQPATPLPHGRLEWAVPWLDTARVTLKLKAFARDATLVAMHELELPFRPAILADRTDDGIYVWLTSPHGQRLYLQRGGAVQQVAICSGAEGRYAVPAARHPLRPHDHHGVFRVQGKVRSCRSSLNQDWLMRYVLRYHNGHAIHATTAGYYHLLGRPASHGCIRLHLKDAVELYGRVGVGERVEVL